MLAIGTTRWRRGKGDRRPRCSFHLLRVLVRKRTIIIDSSVTQPTAGGRYGGGVEHVGYWMGPCHL